MTSIAIVGAGLSGLSVAHLLSEFADITIFEKSRGLGGRMSTRHAEAFSFDHGAQYFTARTLAFQHFLQAPLRLGMVEPWQARYFKFDHGQVSERTHWREDEPRYVGVPNMNSLAKYLAKGLNIHLKTRVISLKRAGHSWSLLDDRGEYHEGFDWVIASMPAPQSALLLPQACTFHADIKDIEMKPCIALMLGFGSALPLEFDAAHIAGADLSWIAANSAKPGRKGQFTLVVHSSEEYAAMHLHDDPKQIIRHLCEEASRITGQDLNSADFKCIHSWHYANNADRESLPVFLDQELRLAACGDWTRGGRVEGAFTSAYELARLMKQQTLV